MPTSDPSSRTIETLAPLIRACALSPVELTESYLRRIAEFDPALNAYVTVLGDTALDDARRAEKEIVAGAYRGPLHGIPIALKDLYDTAGVRTTASSKLYAARIPKQDAHTVQRLRDAGAVLIGKTNMHEFAYGATSSSSYFGAVHNPWDVTRIPGGSSGGSAAAVAGDLCVAATGTDTGGSIRLPAALCGVVGMKPTYGRISCHGILPLSWSLDHPGPITRSVFDAAVMLQVMSGHDPQDPASLTAPVPDYTAFLGHDIRDVRIGYDPVTWQEYATDGIQEIALEALSILADIGADLVEVTIPYRHEAYEAAYTILSAEATAYHEPLLKDHAGDYQPDVRERLLQGFSVRGTDYARAQRVRQQVSHEMRVLFGRIDALISPTCGVQAFPAERGGLTRMGKESNPVDLLTRYTRMFNLSGLPALSVPGGYTVDGLPVGIQFAGPHLGEVFLLRVAHAFETATKASLRYPVLKPVDQRAGP